MPHGRHVAPRPASLPKRAATVGALALATTGSLPVAAPAQAAEPATQPLQAVRDPATVPFTVALNTVLADAPTSPTLYTVVAGDWLSSIAPRVGEDWQRLYADNADVIGADPNLIFPGQQLRVASAPVASNPPPTTDTDGASAAATTADTPRPPKPSPGPNAQNPAGAASTQAQTTGRHAAQVSGGDIVADAQHYLGVPYVWGGESPAGFDCSGLVQYVLGELGIPVPRVAADQATVGTPVGSLADAQPGDLLFFYSPIGHVGIYVGNGQMIDAPDVGETVQVQSVWDTPTAIRRVV